MAKPIRGFGISCRARRRLGQAHPGGRRQGAAPHRSGRVHGRTRGPGAGRRPTHAIHRWRDRALVSRQGPEPGRDGRAARAHRAGPGHRRRPAAGRRGLRAGPDLRHRRRPRSGPARHPARAGAEGHHHRQRADFRRVRRAQAHPHRHRGRRQHRAGRRQHHGDCAGAHRCEDGEQAVCGAGPDALSVSRHAWAGLR